MGREHIEIKHKVLELCAEDDYGSWELWWAISADSKVTTKEDLVSVLEELVNQHALVAKMRAGDNGLLVAPFSRARLSAELKNEARPDPESFYWFGAHDT